MADEVSTEKPSDLPNQSATPSELNNESDIHPNGTEISNTEATVDKPADTPQDDEPNKANPSMVQIESTVGTTTEDHDMQDPNHAVQLAQKPIEIDKEKDVSMSTELSLATNDSGDPNGDDLEKFRSICERLVNGEVDISAGDLILPLILTEDMSSIKNFQILQTLFTDYLHILPHKIISGVLSILIATVKKSVFHLEMSRGLLIPSLKHLVTSNNQKQLEVGEYCEDDQSSYSNISLTKHFLCEWMNLLVAHSCDVEELKYIFKLSEDDSYLLSFVQNANIKQRNRPSSFFAFPGTRGSMMSLPPYQKWPIQLGWSFSTWFLLEPKACAQPYLFNFKTGKSGLGYSAHFTGNCLVLTSIRVKGKGVQHCVAYEFPSHKWIHCAITYHNKWRASEIRVYVNGQLLPAIDIAWQVQTSEIFDKCFIGGCDSISSSNRGGELNSFCGQMSAIYLFNEALGPTQICAIHRLGPSYMGQFKYSNESHVDLPTKICKSLYEEKLASSIFCLFSPVAVDSGTLCIQLAPLRSSTSTPAQNYFMSAPHAALLGQTKAIITQPICSTIQSIGCSRCLLPLLDSYASRGLSQACASVISFLCDLLESSPHWFANEIVQNNGFVMIACSLAKNPRQLLSDQLLEIILNLTRSLLTASNAMGDLMLLKHLMDNLLFNPNLWVCAESSIQLKLYNYLSSEFLNGTDRTTRNHSRSQPNTATGSSSSYVAYNPSSSASSSASMIGHDQSVGSGESITPYIATDMLFGEVRRVSTVLQCLHALKYYYWIVEEKDICYKAQDRTLRPNRNDLAQIRSQILLFTRKLIIKSNSVPLDETQGILNYLSSCNRAENLVDVMDTLTSLLSDYHEVMVSALDQKQAIKVIFGLISSPYEEIRIKALQLLTILLSKCSHKRKQDIMGPNNLFMLLRDRLKSYLPMSSRLYEALLDLMLESVDLLDKRKSDANNPTKIISHDLRKKRIENSIVIKVIASLIRDDYANRRPQDANSSNTTNENSQQQPGEVVDIRARFINDLWSLIINSRENRRIILQMSVWQHWLINLIASTVTDTQLVRDQVLAIFRVLLHHATRYEYGGWRVWIDTLAIIHTKVSLDEFLHIQTNPNQSTYTNERHSSQLTNDSSNNNLSHEPECDKSEQRSTDDKSPSENVESKSKELDQETDNKETDESESFSPISELDTNKIPIVSSISDRIISETSGININGETQGIDVVDSKAVDSSERLSEVDLSTSASSHDDTAQQQPSEVIANNDNEAKTLPKSESMDSVDIAPTRSFRRSSKNNVVVQNQQATSDRSEHEIYDSHHDDNESNRASNIQLDKGFSRHQQQQQQSIKATVTPAFRIPEFKWNSILIKLLNDLMFSIECDLYNWKCSGNCMNLDMAPFIPRSINPNVSNSATSSNSSTGNRSNSTTAATIYFEQLLQRTENQVYLINIIHFVSQLSDNIIIAAGGLLPLLADATGGARNPQSSPTTPEITKTLEACEGLQPHQANSLLYRLTNIIDVAVFAASHINLTELEADKNTTNGGILRQCLRLACTVTVKNCLIIRSLSNRIQSMDVSCSTNDIPKDYFDSYQGCSLLSANSLFVDCQTLDSSDLVANPEYSPNQTPNSSSMPSLLPFQSNPIKDPNKLLQTIDSCRIQACIYHTMNLESRESQFLALSSLYFISVLMVSKYRDIIEPKQQPKKKHENEEQDVQQSTTGDVVPNDPNSPISNIESNLLTFGRMQPTTSSSTSQSEANSLTDILTKKLEYTLDTVCPLLKSIMCNFCGFLSKTLIGSHGQDLVNKEADRAFRCANTSPVELVMLLCSQEWQNTLQKNAGLAFIELINEGRMSSIGMKEHIVRVAMEAEFILSRLRADDVAKHEIFSISCSESLSARLHEESLINSLLSSALRRDFALYYKFLESVKSRNVRYYKLDIWEDDDRRRRRFIIDSCSNKLQQFYASKAQTTSELSDKTENTKRILDLQETLEMSGIDDQCSPNIHNYHNDQLDNSSSPHREDGMLSEDKDYECEDEEFDDDEDDDHGPNGSNSPDSDAVHHHHNKLNHEDDQESSRNSDLRASSGRMINNKPTSTGRNRNQLKGGVRDMRTYPKSQAQHGWGMEDCSNVNEINGSVIFAAECSLIWNIYAVPGIIQITNDELHFESNQNISEIIDAFKRDPDFTHPGLRLDNPQQSRHNDHQSMRSGEQSLTNQEEANNNDYLRPIDLRVLCYCDFLSCNGKVPLGDIRAIFSRHYLLQPHALEIFLAQRTSIMFAFNDFETVKRVVKYLPPVGVGIKYGIPQSRRASFMSARQLFAASNMTQKWQRREIGNFQYLMFLNTIAGRTYQDLNQYPVFPWILTNYESEELDLNLPSNFRDLSKPVGALNSERRDEFIERYQSWDNSRIPAFHYGTHYSTAAFTLNWLCRMRGSLNSAYLALHDGKYEDDARLFLSINDSWVGSLAGGQQNVKELIPEFFYLAAMFHSNLNLPQVELPPWAKTPEQFVRLHRLALESELVSCQLHQWIDLIFGYKQRGTEAINAVNTFYYLTYQGNVNLSMIQDPALREAIATQIKHFGQTPSQLTTEPHPPRFSALHVSPLMFSAANDDVNKVVKLPFNTSVVHIAPCIENMIKGPLPPETQGSSTGTIPNTSSINCASSILTITGNNQYQIHNWNPNDQTGHPFVLDPQLSQPSMRRQLIDIDDLSASLALKLLSYSSSSQLNTDKLEIEWPKAHFVSTLDGRFLIMGSFYDNSFRVFSTSNGKLCQVIYGHQAPITCMTRSEGNATADFHLATGSQDCSLLLWTWNERYAQIEGSGVSPVHNPLPKLTISGHQTPVLSAIICAELGLIISGSKNLILAHTTTTGENLLEIDVNPSELFGRMAESQILRHGTSPDSDFPRPQVKNKERTLLEASMLGDAKPGPKKVQPASNSSTAAIVPNDCYLCEKYSHMKDFSQGDYYITNLQLARELAFIVCIALPPPRRKKATRVDSKSDSRPDFDNKAEPSALLLTFNLKGDVMECTTIGHSINGPRLGDSCVLQATRDGEHLVLNDSPTSLKIYRTFDLQPTYAYNTNDIQSTPSDEQNRVRSLSLVDHRYIIVGLENGKIVIYNADFKNSH